MGFMLFGDNVFSVDGDLSQIHTYMEKVREHVGPGRQKLEQL